MLTQEMKRNVAIVSIYGNHCNLEINNFLNVARSFVHKVWFELETCDGIVFPILKKIIITMLK